MESEGRRIDVLMFPWLAHGHISPFLELAKKLSERNFYIYFCSTPVNLEFFRPKLSREYSSSIKFIELHLPTLNLPAHYHTAKGLPPHLMETLTEALEMASPGFFNILKALKPDLLIYDFVQPWAPDLASSLNIPAVFFLTGSASMTTQHLRIKNPGEEFPFLEIDLKGYLKEKTLEDISSPFSSKIIEGMLQCYERSSNILLVKTFKELEGKYLDYLTVDLVKKKMIPVGPLVQQDPIHEDDRQMEVIEWLDKKERSSTVFVSFGSEYFLSREERECIGHGLELSKVNFIWVIRFPLGEEITLEDALPKGYLERVSERGLVIEGWAPQAKILGHPSIGGFVSHCGWSSVMESMKFGVPIVAMPMDSDQPFNARLVENVGVAIEVFRNNNGGFESEEIARVTREVVVEKVGEGVRKKAREMSEIMSNKGDEEMDEVGDELVQLCNLKSKVP